MCVVARQLLRSVFGGSRKNIQRRKTKPNNVNYAEDSDCNTKATFAGCFLGISFQRVYESEVNKMRERREILPGQKFGRLTVIREAERQYGHRYILCRCDCGNEKTINLNSLIKGMSNSCGCYRKEFIANRNYKHGHTYRADGVERLYRIWQGMKRRCYDADDPGYNNYGARGITICDEWIDDYSTFREWANNNGYSNELTIDRIDNDKGYSPDNCRWATVKEQSNNTRHNHRVTYCGETHTLSEWGDILGISDDLIGQRLRKGLPLEQVFFVGNLRYYKQEEMK